MTIRYNFTLSTYVAIADDGSVLGKFDPALHGDLASWEASMKAQVEGGR